MKKNRARRSFRRSAVDHERRRAGRALICDRRQRFSPERQNQINQRNPQQRASRGPCRVIHHHHARSEKVRENEQALFFSSSYT